MQYGTEFIKIAVVDDEPLWQQRTVEIIEKECGLDAPHIDRYANGQALLDAQIFYDLLFMDVEMKGLDGFETAQRYQRQYKCDKIAMLTSHTELSRRGYQYLREAIFIVATLPDTRHQVAKVVYERIAGEHGVTASTVERAVRHAIETAWGRGDMDTLDQIFGYTVQASKGRPTNTEYIAAVADYLKLTERV